MEEFKPLIGSHTDDFSIDIRKHLHGKSMEMSLMVINVVCVRVCVCV